MSERMHRNCSESCQLCNVAGMTIKTWLYCIFDDNRLPHDYLTCEKYVPCLKINKLSTCNKMYVLMFPISLVALDPTWCRAVPSSSSTVPGPPRGHRELEPQRWPE